jgi:FAD/FMN-containing dehydrogenase
LAAVARARARAGGVPWERLRSRLRGPLVLPADAAYPDAKHLAQLRFDVVNPRAIAYCETEADVAACLRFARDHDVAVTPRSSGHSLAGWSTTTGLVIDLSRLAHVVLENGENGENGETVRVGAGAQAVDVLDRLAPHGRQLPAGLCGTVCLGGFLTGGGIGWTTRYAGLAADRLVAARVTLADGRTVRCTAGAGDEEHADLHWALRGGGADNFGIVTEFEVRPTRIARVTTYALSWPWQQAAEAVTAWQQWTAHGPDTLGGTLDVLLDDAAPGAEPVVYVQGCLVGPAEELEPLLDELASLAGFAPASREVAEKSYDAAMMALWGCTGTVEECHLEGHNPVANLPRHQLIASNGRLLDAPLSGSRTGEALAALEAGRRAGQFHNLSMYALGGAAGHPGPGQTAFPHRSARFFTGYSAGFSGTDDAEEAGAAAEGWVAAGMRVLDPERRGAAYLNFPDAGLADWRSSYYGANYARLRAVKRRYDPDGYFRRPQSIET